MRGGGKEVARAQRLNWASSHHAPASCRLFFVDLPAAPVREIIFGLHLKKRGLDPAGFQMTHAHIERELGQTRPVSVIRAEDFERLRTWASQRCVMVD